MKLAPIVLPRLIPPPARRRADENRSELERLELNAEALAGTLDQLASAPEAERPSWEQVRTAFVTIGSAVESLGDVESALAADEGRWLSQLAVEDPEAGDADAIEYCQDRLGKIRTRLQRHRAP